ncbi:MAG: sodium:alanine symporter family protein [Deltaproteobacteria bacterium]|nr:sodium:alanine symporter family protein [Deltaproteobacteria bacterium]
MERLMETIGYINGFLWGAWTLYILLGAGILFTVWAKFSQFKVLTHGVAVTRGIYDDPDDPGAINHFQALSAALSATIGLGNIGGVAVAIALGGPGALFWIWIVGFLGMALKSVEITLAMLYRNTDDPDDPHGGAMWVIDKTLGAKNGFCSVAAKTIGVIFCITLLIMTMAGGNMFQTWNVADLTLNYFGVPKIATGVVLAILVGLVIVGGIKRIGQVAARLVPVMCILYLLSGLAVLALNVHEIPAMLALIFKCALGETEAAGAFLGGTFGFVFAQGMKRALFSNEAGLGSAPIAHAAAKTNEPAREGIVGGMGPFIDTLCICTLTALVIISTGTWNRGPAGEMAGEVELVEKDGKVALIAPDQVSALPELPVGESWKVNTQVFFLLSKPADQEGQWKRIRIYGTIQGDDLGRPQTIEWEEIPVGARWVLDKNGQPVKGLFRNFAGATLTGHAFDRAFPGLGKWLVTLAAWLFAVSTMISWSYYGEQGMVYMFGKRSVLPYKLLFLLLAVVGAFLVKNNTELGALADFGTGWMLWANMLIVLTMGHLAVKALDNYFKRLKAGTFHPHSRPPIVDVVAGKDAERERGT